MTTGGREAEIEAVARALWEREREMATGQVEQGMEWEEAPEDERAEWGLIARVALAALDSVRGTGSAAQPYDPELRGTHSEMPDEGPPGSAARNQDRPKVPKIAAKREGEYGLEIDFEAARSPQTQEKVARMPEAAARWLREHADDLGLDPEGAAEAADDLARAVADPVRSPQSENHEELGVAGVEKVYEDLRVANEVRAKLEDRLAAECPDVGAIVAFLAAAGYDAAAATVEIEFGRPPQG